MRVTSNIIILLFITVTILFSCKDTNHSLGFLDRAQGIIESNPKQALIILDSIDNPRSMDTDSYMQYILAYVGAKHEMKADVGTDTLIFDAQNYFTEKGDYKNLALANYYAGCVYYAHNNLPESLESFMQAVYVASKLKENFLAGKSLNNIGYIYYAQDLFDSAAINYHKALFYYNKLKNVDQNKMRVFTNIGLAYEADNGLDSAYIYIQKGLNLAKDGGHKLQEIQIYQNLGVTCFGMGRYDKAIEYFQSALDMNLGKESETRQIYLYLLKIYNKKQDLNFAKQYADLVITNLPEVTYNYTTKEMYAALADYYQQSGEYKKSLEYRNLEKATKEEIEKEADGAALLAADKNFHLSQKDKEVKQFRSHIYLFLMIGGIAFCIVLVFFLFVWRDNKKGKAEIRECADRYNEIKVLLFAMGEKYPKIEAEIKSILEAD